MAVIAPGDQILGDLDNEILFYVNSTLASPIFDPAFLTLSSETFWISLLAITAIILHVVRNKTGIKCVWTGIVALGISDLVAYRIIKPAIERPRPCYAMPEKLRLIVDGCGSAYGMPSNHAANAMALATVIYLFFGRSVGIPVAIVAIAVAISRVYLGVHYPTDILAGGVLGVAVGWLVTAILKRSIFKYFW